MKKLCMQIVSILMITVLIIGTKRLHFVKADDELDEQGFQVNVDFFDYNIKEYNGTNISDDDPDDLRIAWNKKVRETYPDKGLYQLFLLGGNRNGSRYGAQNAWLGKTAGQVEGIVSQELNQKGDLTFNERGGYGYFGINLFPNKDEINEYNGIIDAYYDVNFKFYNNDGMYEFDSKKYAAYNLTKTSNGKSKIDMDFTQQGPNFQTSQAASQNIYGFYPLNQAEGTNLLATSDRHDLFGMKIQFDFYMPENGRVGRLSNPNAKENMIFSFAGDDDVWVFVDGKLCLDLGGIHNVASGSIDFCTGDVTYNQTKAAGYSYNVKNIYESYNISKETFSKHTLTMFYLERGEYDSNCKISFNIPVIQKTNNAQDISITKKAVGVPNNVNDTYEFQLKYGDDAFDLDKTFTGEYEVYDKNHTYKETDIATNGKIHLLAGETAVIGYDKIPFENFYIVQEKQYGKRYNIDWFYTNDTGQGSGNGKKTAVLKKNSLDVDGNHIEFVNKYQTLTKLVLTKEMEDGSMPSDEFSFLVNIDGVEETVKLKAGESKVYNEVPLCADYSIIEMGVADKPKAEINNVESEVVKCTQGYAVSGAVVNNLAEGETTAIKFINKKIVPSPTPIVTPKVITGTQQSWVSCDPGTQQSWVSCDPGTQQSWVSCEPSEKTPNPLEMGYTNLPKSTTTPNIEPSPFSTPMQKQTVAPTVMPKATKEVTPTPTVTPKVIANEKTPNPLELGCTNLPKSTATPNIEPSPFSTPTQKQTVVPTVEPKTTKEVVLSPTPTVTPKTTNVPTEKNHETNTPMTTITPTTTNVSTSEPPKNAESIAPQTNNVVKQLPAQMVTNEAITQATEAPKAQDECVIVHNMDSIPNTQKYTNTNSSDIIVNTPTARRKTKDENEFIVANDCPNKLPQTGEIGAIAHNRKEILFLFGTLYILLVLLVKGAKRFFVDMM